MSHQYGPEFEQEVNEALSEISEILNGKKSSVVMSIAGSLYVRIIQTYVADLPKEGAEINIKPLEDGQAMLNEEMNRIFIEKRNQILDS